MAASWTANPLIYRQKDKYCIYVSLPRLGHLLTTWGVFFILTSTVATGTPIANMWNGTPSLGGNTPARALPLVPTPTPRGSGPTYPLHLGPQYSSSIR